MSTIATFIMFNNAISLIRGDCTNAGFHRGSECQERRGKGWEGVGCRRCYQDLLWPRPTQTADPWSWRSTGTGGGYAVMRGSPCRQRGTPTHGLLLGSCQSPSTPECIPLLIINRTIIYNKIIIFSYLLIVQTLLNQLSLNCHIQNMVYSFWDQSITHVNSWKYQTVYCNFARVREKFITLKL